MLLHSRMDILLYIVNLWATHLELSQQPMVVWSLCIWQHDIWHHGQSCESILIVISHWQHWHLWLIFYQLNLSIFPVSQTSWYSQFPLSSWLAICKEEKKYWDYSVFLVKVLKHIWQMISLVTQNMTGICYNYIQPRRYCFFCFFFFLKFHGT